MSASHVPPIGERIRAERVHQGRSLRALARDLGVSASLISQIETGKSQPSVSTLYAITTALGISVEDLFAGCDDPVAPPGDGSRDPKAPLAVRAVAADIQSRVGPIVRPSEREMLTLDSGVTWELLGQIPEAHVEFLRVTYEPGGTSSSSGRLMRHSGTEYAYLVSGELVLTLAFEEHRLTAGDAVSFDSATPHGYRNEGSEPAVGVWFVLER